MDRVTCDVSKQEVPASDASRADLLREPIFNLIKSDHPDFTRDSWISNKELTVYRKRYLGTLVEEEIGDVDHLEKDVIDAITHNRILSENIEQDIEEKLTVGQRVADRIADFGGSWTFIIFFFSFLAIWMMINIVVLIQRPFDPYPFILLNLILSCLAAIQAPIIMMSQNRQEEKDRQRSEHDYKVNLKAELEIRLLHEKLDHLMIHQNRRLVEIQEIQADYLEDILTELKKKGRAIP